MTTITVGDTTMDTGLFVVDDVENPYLRAKKDAVPGVIGCNIINKLKLNVAEKTFDTGKLSSINVEPWDSVITN
jgi:hypothetical protein